METIDNDFLRTFVGGIWYFRVVCLDTSIDAYYLIRSRIIRLEMTGRGDLSIGWENMSKNRYMVGAWYDHAMKATASVFPKERVPKNQKLIALHSSSILYVTIDPTADGIVYKNESDQPNEKEAFRDFPLQPYDKLLGLRTKPL